eukprot:1731557-Prymnesium_polylepis.1
MEIDGFGRVRAALWREGERVGRPLDGSGTGLGSPSAQTNLTHTHVTCCNLARRNAQQFGKRGQLTYGRNGTKKKKRTHASQPTEEGSNPANGLNPPPRCEPIR